MSEESIQQESDAAAPNEQEPSKDSGVEPKKSDGNDISPTTTEFPSADTNEVSKPQPPPPPSSVANMDAQTKLQQQRSAAHSKMRAYESKRRSAYSSKMQSSSLYWRAFRFLMHDSLVETQKADILVRGWTHTNEAYGASMQSVGGWCIDEKGTPITDAKKKKKWLETHEKGIALDSVIGSGGVGAGEKRGPLPGNFDRTDKAPSLVDTLANSAGLVADRYNENVRFMKTEVLPDLASLHEQLKKEVSTMEKLGDAIMDELNAAENEASKAWDAYYNIVVEFIGMPTETLQERRGGAQTGTVVDPNAAIDGCSDVWINEMRYRMAVAFLSSCWEKCSVELSKLFLSMKETECQRRGRMKELLIKSAQRQERLWMGLPSVITPVIKELIEWPMERKAVEDDVQSSIRVRAQIIQREEAERKKSNEPKAAGLSGVDPNEGNFELSSPLVSDLMCRAKVIEKRGMGMMSSWKVTLAIVTADSFLQLFELPPSCKLQPGSAPEVAFQNLIPPVVVPTMEGVKSGVKLPATKSWFDLLVPSESLALPNCVISFKDEKTNSAFEIVETVLTSGASKMFTKTLNRKLLLRAVTREESIDFMEALTSPE